MPRIFPGFPPRREPSPAYADCGSQDDDCYAYPYMADFYTLACNQDLFAAQDVPTPLDSGISYENFIAALSRLSFYGGRPADSPLSLTVTSGLHPKAALLWLKTAASGEDWLEGDLPWIRLWALFPSRRTVAGKCFFRENPPCISALPQNMNSFFRPAGQFPEPLQLFHFQLFGYGADDRPDGHGGFRQICGGPGFCPAASLEKAQKGRGRHENAAGYVSGRVYEGQTLYLEEYASLGANGNIPNNFLLAANQKKRWTPRWTLLSPVTKISKRKVTKSPVWAC